MSETTGFDTETISERRKVYNEGSRLFEQIHDELERIREQLSAREHRRLWKEIYQPEGYDVAELKGYVAWHGLIGSGIPVESPEFEIDLPGDQSLLKHARKKLEKLKNI